MEAPAPLAYDPLAFNWREAYARHHAERKAAQLAAQARELDRLKEQREMVARLFA